MKTFIYVVSDLKGRSHNRVASIYRVKNNVPECVGSVEWSTASFKGEDSCVASALVKSGLVPKSILTDGTEAWRGAGYYVGNHAQGKVRLMEVQ